MKINIIKNKRKKLANIIIIIILTLVLIITGIFYFLQNKQPKVTPSNQTIDYNPPTEEQIKAGGDIKNKTTTTMTSLSASINPINVDGDPIQIRVIINGVISNDGQCDLVISNDNTNTNITKTASTFAMPSYSTCEGFEVSRSELSSGTWKVNVSVNINSETVNTTSEFILE